MSQERPLAGMPLWQPEPSPKTGATPPATYVVSLPVFQGPLDLLLHLIEREELDITAVSLVQVTDQYLAYIEGVRETDLDSLADFLVVAARLLLIKSRALLPRPPAVLGEEEEEDPGELLARQLREYKRYKEVARGLSQRESDGLHSFVRLAPAPKPSGRVDLEGITLDALLEAVRRALAVVPETPTVDHVVGPFRITIGERAAHILSLAAAGTRFTFLSLLENARSRVEIIVTLLAVLELFKRGKIAVRQESLFGEIFIEAGSRIHNDTNGTSEETWGSEFEGTDEGAFED